MEIFRRYLRYHRSNEEDFGSYKLKLKDMQDF
jgi:hypothetical protein